MARTRMEAEEEGPKRPCAALLALAVALGWALPLLAGTSADLKGKITDRSGSPLPGVTVGVWNEVLGVGERGTVTDAAGSYRFRGLLSGPGYRVRASLPSYAPIEFSDIALEAGEASTLDMVLRPASEVQEMVRVRGRTSVVNPESVVTSTTFTSTFIAGLPILGRDYQDILTLAPGVTDVNHTGNPNIHGARDTDVVTLVDGVSTTDPLTGYYGQDLNIESIQEIEVITSGATAEFSRAQGGFANIITKSGGNEFTGTFKLFVRSNRLDGDGAGIDPPELTNGLGGARSLAQLSFTDLKPFLSVSGPLVRDRLWYYVSNEYIQVENPVNDLTQAFVTRTMGYREFGKISWQATPQHRLAFSVTLDRERDENQGIDSLKDVESGYTFQRGGPVFTLKGTSTFGPSRLLDSTVSWFDNRFSQTPTLDPDTNGNGILYRDLSGDGIFQARERDAGEDWDWDGRYDINEGVGYDVDGDHRLRGIYRPCEGRENEDANCNGYLDAEVDRNQNHALDLAEDVGIPCYFSSLCLGNVITGTRGNGKFDTEDRNGNGLLDVVGDSGYTPFPFWEDRNGNGRIETGEFRAPQPPDLDLITDEEGRTYGSNPFEYRDHRKRFTLREDLSAYLSDLGGSHDLKVGFVIEHEGYDRDTLRRANLDFPAEGPTPRAKPGGGSSEDGHSPGKIFASMGIPANVNNVAVGDNLGIYLQDTYKPLANLTLGLGVRVDLENISTNGFTDFDPRIERRAYDRLQDAAGVDMDPYDSIFNAGLCLDPLHSCGNVADPTIATITATLQRLAFLSFTRHNLDVEIFSPLPKDFLGRNLEPDPSLPQGIQFRRPEEFRITNANLSPRLSLSWDPWGDGRTKAFASWGRYYDKLFLASIVLEQGPDTVSRTYGFDPFGVNYDGNPNYRLGKVISQSPLSATQVDRNLATPYSDELTVGFERELAPECSAGVRYIRRDYRDQLQDVDINHHLETDPRTGLPADRIGLVDCDLEICEGLPNGLPDLHIENFYFNRILRLGNYNTQTYRGWELEFVRRLSRRWQMEANYTYSTARGDAESYLSNAGDDPGLAEYESGYLAYDQRHVVKVNAIAYLPGDWRLGGSAQWSSGLPYSSIMRAVDADDGGYYQNRLLYGRLGPTGLGFNRELRNIHRNPASYLFNARVQKAFVMGKASASAFFEVYNMLNSDTLRISSLRQIPPRVWPSLAPGGAAYVRPGTERVVGERDFGRRFQVGIQVDF